VLAAMLLCAGLLAGGPGLPAAILLTVGTVGTFAVLLAWARFGRQHLPARGLIAIPAELIGRVSILSRFLSGRQGTWVRTARRPIN
jgi:hypothetical protein